MPKCSGKAIEHFTEFDVVFPKSISLYAPKEKKHFLGNAFHSNVCTEGFYLPSESKSAKRNQIFINMNFTLHEVN